MAVGVGHRSTKHSGFENQNLFLPDLSIVMSYDSLGLRSSIGVNETKPVLVTGFADHLNTPTSGQSNASVSHSQSSKKRRSSKGKSLPEIRRSSSTPHMRNLALANSGDLSPTSEKRRNKLGYHRTSVACGKSHVLRPRVKNTVKSGH